MDMLTTLALSGAFNKTPPENTNVQQAQNISFNPLITVSSPDSNVTPSITDTVSQGLRSKQTEGFNDLPSSSSGYMSAPVGTTATPITDNYTAYFIVGGIILIAFVLYKKYK